MLERKRLRFSHLDAKENDFHENQEVNDEVQAKYELQRLKYVTSSVWLSVGTRKALVKSRRSSTTEEG